MTSRLDSIPRGERRRAQRYLIEFGAAIVAYVAVLLATQPLAAAAGASPWHWFWAAVPVVPIAGAAIVVVRHLRRIDEFERLRALEGLAVGFVVAMLTAVTFALTGFGGTAGAWWIYSAGMAAWLVTAIVQRLR